MDGIPVGLKNVGNTCYFNSFIQAFFFLPNMTEKLLFNPIRRAQTPHTSEPDEVKIKRVEASNVMARELQALFASMLYTNQSYVDPSGVLNNMVDDSGYKCPVGE